MNKKNKENRIFDKHPVKLPWHLWVMAILFIFIFGNGVYDYFMMLGHNAAYYNSKHYGEAVMVYFTNYPIVCLVFYTLNVFCGLASAILLLLRNRWSQRLVLVSGVSMVGLDILTFGFRNRFNVFGLSISIFDLILLIMTWLFFFYCRALSKRGLLK